MELEKMKCSNCCHYAVCAFKKAYDEDICWRYRRQDSFWMVSHISDYDITCANCGEVIYSLDSVEEINEYGFCPGCGCHMHLVEEKKWD